MKSSNMSFSFSAAKVDKTYAYGNTQKVVFWMLTPIPKSEYFALPVWQVVVFIANFVV
jgi:hypothetical protein